jgi:DNA-binding HxlR family transcriptional regulator
MQRTDDADTAMRHLLDRLGEKWTAHTVAALGKGPKRFGELRREVGGVSQKVLTERVRSLERDGFLSRHVLARAPPQVEYRLTPLGRSLASLLDQIRNWADAHMTEGAALHIVHDDLKRCEPPYRRGNGESGLEGEAPQCGNEPRPLD